ncbi:DNA repair protein RecN [Lancefieldella parvula]|uniref:DNA repair protein RecN n=1 Tax=Lancefieldella parvula TaxID=1382 RepID=UPI00288064B2|nr:DNA repair protein RecN [Lancefieldella parvula]
MLDELRVQNVALIEDASFAPASGLTVLTGETGAGKTALLSSIKLLVGERADASMVREGTDALRVEARFFISSEDQEGIVVSRKVSADGRGRVEIDGHMTSVKELAGDIGTSIDLCGQHEHQRLLDVKNHVSMLDAWIGPDIQSYQAEYADALHAYYAAIAELQRVIEVSQSSNAKIDEASFLVQKIDEVSPKKGELEDLEEQLPRFEHAEALLQAAGGTHELLSSDEGVIDSLSEAVQTLQNASTFDATLGSYAESLSSALIEIEDVSSELRSYVGSLDFDEEALEEMQSRMARLQGLMRTYGPGMKDVFKKYQAAQNLLEVTRDTKKLVREAQAEVDKAKDILSVKANALKKVRVAAAPKLCDAVNKQMSHLQMGSAQIELNFEDLPFEQWNKVGSTKIELMYKPSAQMTARPLRKIASGGEVSRVMLACKVVLGESDDCDTLVFDEVDAGVGGTTAVALAEVLAQLAKTHQVIVVTHLPQVAVLASKHYVVSKTEEHNALPITSLTEVSGTQREEEIARMLSGSITEASLAHAHELLTETY